MHTQQKKDQAAGMDSMSSTAPPLPLPSGTGAGSKDDKAGVEQPDPEDFDLPPRQCNLDDDGSCESCQ